MQRYNRLAVGIIPAPRRPWCPAAELAGHVKEVSFVEKRSTALSARGTPKFQRWDDPDYRKWKDQEEEILRDTEPIISLAKEILHPDRYMDGESLTVVDEEAVVEKLLRHHPHSEDKIGCGLVVEKLLRHHPQSEDKIECGLDSIMVDQHPQFRHSRCLFVVRTDGGWIDFSYQKCLQAYIRDKYPSHAEQFIREHVKRVSG